MANLVEVTDTDLLNQLETESAPAPAPRYTPVQDPDLLKTLDAPPSSSPTVGERPEDSPADPPAGQGFFERWITNPLARGKNQGLDPALDVGMFLAGQTTPEEFAQGIVTNYEEAAAYPRDPRDEESMRKFQQAKGWGDAAGVLWDNPNIIGQTAVESLPAMGAAAAGSIAGGLTGATAGSVVPGVGTAIGGTLGAAAGTGLASGYVEFSNSLVEALTDTGKPVTRQNVLSAIQDPDILAAAKDKALKRGMAVGAFDALAAGIAGRIAKPVQKLVGTGTTGRTISAGAEVAGQSAAGAAGEATAQIATEGEINKPGNVILEGAAELVTAPVEIGSAIAGREFPQQIFPDSPQPAPEQTVNRAGKGDRIEPRLFPDRQAAEQPAAPGAAPEAGPQQPGPGPAAPPPGFVFDDAWLAGAGYTPEQISDMNPEERTAAAEEARSQGVEPVDLTAGAPQPGASPMAPRGTRKAKATVQTEQDLEEVRPVVNAEPSERQAAAGNYQKGHIRLHGLDVSIENPRGSVRRGRDEDGKDWASPQLPADYGYIKRTTGKDGDHVDVYIGPNPQSDRVFVVDQLNLKNGRFDEHKSILGANSLGEAVDLYVNSFDNPTLDRIGDVTEMSVDEFKQWVRDGRLTKRPAARAGVGVVTPNAAEQPQNVQGIIPETPGLPAANTENATASPDDFDAAFNAALDEQFAPEVPAAAQPEPVSDKVLSSFLSSKKPLTAEAFAKHAKIGVNEAGRALQQAALQGRIMQGRNGQWRRNPVRSTPVNVLDFIASIGGISDPTGELAGMDLPKMTPYGPVVRKSGLHPDRVREALVEAGYMQDAGWNGDRQQETTVADVYDVISRHMSGQKVYAQQDQTWADNVETTRRAEFQNPELEDIHPVELRWGKDVWQQITDFLAENGSYEEAWSPGEINDVARMVAEGMNPDDAFERAAIMHVEELMDDLDIAPEITAAFEKNRANAMVAFETPPFPDVETQTNAVQQQGSPEEGDGVRAPGEAGFDGTGEGEVRGPSAQVRDTGESGAKAGSEGTAAEGVARPRRNAIDLGNIDSEDVDPDELERRRLVAESDNYQKNYLPRIETESLPDPRRPQASNWADIYTLEVEPGQFTASYSVMWGDGSGRGGLPSLDGEYYASKPEAQAAMASKIMEAAARRNGKQAQMIAKWADQYQAVAPEAQADSQARDTDEEEIAVAGQDGWLISSNKYGMFVDADPVQTVNEKAGAASFKINVIEVKPGQFTASHSYDLQGQSGGSSPATTGDRYMFNSPEEAIADAASSILRQFEYDFRLTSLPESKKRDAKKAILKLKELGAVSQKDEAPAPSVEPGAENKPQLVIPGTEQDRKGAMNNAAKAPLKAKAPQKGMDVGLFGSERDQVDLFDKPARKTESETDKRAKAIKEKLVLFSSGMSRLKDFVSGAYATGTLATRGIGIDINETSDVNIAEMADKVVQWQARTFIDSGAFGIFKRNLKEQQRYEAAVADLFQRENAAPPKLSKLSAAELLKRYDAVQLALSEASERAGEEAYPPPLFVAPDIVGDQNGSIELVRQNATWLKRHLNAGREVIIPVQKGDLTLAEAYREVENILGRNDFVVGVPSNQKAVSDNEFAEFVAATKPPKLHFLGTTDEGKLQPRIDAIASAGYVPDHISSDANMLRALLYGRSSIEETRDEGVRRVLRERSPEFQERVGKETPGQQADDFDAALNDALDAEFGAQEPDNSVEINRKWDWPISRITEYMGPDYHESAWQKATLRAWTGSLTDKQYRVLTRQAAYNFPISMADTAEEGRLLAAWKKTLETGKTVTLDPGDYSKVLEDTRDELLGKKQQQKPSGKASGLQGNWWEPLMGFESEGSKKSKREKKPAAEDPSIPVGFELTSVNRLSKAEVKDTVWKEGQFKAIVKRERPYGVFDAMADTRAEAIVKALAAAQPKTAGEAAASAAKNAAMGLDEVAKGLSTLFGGKNKLSSGFTFDEDTYRQALPYFKAGVSHLKAAGSDVVALVRALVAKLKEMGLERDAIENMRPYLRRFVEDVQAGKETLGDTPPAAAQENGKFHPIVSAFVDYLSQPDGAFDTITEARKFAAERGFKVQPGTPEAKELDEMLELAVVLTARTLVGASKSRPVKTAYRRLVDLYRRQPNLGVRTSQSMADQAYSTPAPLAYIASRLAGVAAAKSVLEPTAGNGMLLIEASPSKADVNELNDRRAAALKAQGFRVSQKDAATEKLRHVGYPVDSVIANPPFGAVPQADGSSKVFTFENWNTTQIDHVIALQALKSLKDDGRAVLIVGSVKEGTDKTRSDSYNTKQKREFYWRLYQGYNVTDHFTVAGDLYKRQGAGWPVDVIVIEGRGKSARPLPAVELPKVYDTWDALEEKLDEAPAQSQAGAGSQIDGTAVSGPSDGSNVAEDGSRLESGSGVDQRPPGRGGAASVSPAAEGQGAIPDGGNQRESSDLGEQQSRQPDRGQMAAGERTNGDGNREPPVPGRERLKQDAEAAQQPYRPMSSQKTLDTNIPTNMATAVETALQDLAARHGAIDGWIEKELGYKKGEIGKYLAAEQVDAVALALDNVKKNAAFIIGDQTGIGKGRVVASALRYAMRKGLVPIFVTEKPNLYGDIIRDLNDIGVPEMLGRDLKPFLTNAGEAIPLDDDAVAWYDESQRAKAEGQPSPAKRGKFLRASGGDLHKRQMAALQKDGTGKDFDIIFTTYDQMNTVKGQTTDRRRLVEGLADRAFMVLDESHNAGGTEASGWQAKNAPESRSDFLKKVTSKAQAVMFSSATYAKRPGVMALYARTDMGKAVEKPEMLGELIERGGVPMQQVVAAMLAKAGQYIRRERSFDGVSYDVEPVEVDTAAYRAVSRSLAAIAKFDIELKDSSVWEEIKKNLKDNAEALAMDSGTGDVSVNSTNFTSLMHNIVNQMLLAIKTDAVATRAIQALKANEKPVITVANTMGAFLKSYAEDNDIKIGDAVDLSFRDVLRRYLERTLRVTIKRPDNTKYHVQIPLSSIPGFMQNAYREAESLIEQIDTANLPISPIDWLRFRLANAGYRVSEITGRKDILDYSGPDKASFAQRLDSEVSPAGRRVNIDKFNRGDIDVMILNRAGSTGLSLHASSKFKDQRRRRMIIAQAELNIDVHMQMLGRVHRTGQVVPPAFVQAYADVPAEARPAAVLAKKMASLNANTTASRKSAFSADDSVDFLNEYGDQVAREYLTENSEIADLLDVSLDPEKETARELTGRLLLLDVDDQRKALDEITARYKVLIQNLDAMGENALEAKTMDLSAKTVSRQELKPSEGDSPFTQAVILEEVEVKAQGKALPLPEIIEKAADALGAGKVQTEKPESAINELGRIADKLRATFVKKWVDDFDRMVADDLRNTKTADVRAKRSETHTQNRQRFEHIMDIAMPGRRVTVRSNDGAPLTGIVMNVSRRGQTGATGNPLALGAWTAEIAIPDNAQRISVPFSSLALPGDTVGEGQRKVFINGPDWATGIQQTVAAFEKARQTGKETRYIVTGNILAGFDQTKGQGQIVNYTDDQGNVKPGILMSKAFSPKNFLAERAVRFKTASQVMTFLKQLPAAEITSHDEIIAVRTSDSTFEIDMPAARQSGGTYFLNPEVRKAARDQFTKIGSRMRFRTRSEAEATAVLDAMMQAGAVFQTTENQEAAEQIISGGKPKQAPLSSRAQAALSGLGRREVAAPSQNPYRFVITRKQRAELTAEIRDIARRLLGRQLVDIAFTDNLGEGEDAFFDPNTGIIHVALQGMQNPRSTVRHEAIHALRQAGVITAREWAVLSRTAQTRWIEQYSIRERYEALYRERFDIRPEQLEELIIEEAVADAMADHWAKPPAEDVVSRIFSRVKTFLEAVRNMLRGRGFTTADQILANIERGGMGERQAGTGQGRDFLLYARQASREINAPELKRIGYREDNPGGQWLEKKQAYAEEDMAAAKTASGRKGLYGPTTGSTQPVLLPVSDLKTLRGANDERPRPGNPKYDELVQDIARRGYTNEDEVVVVVNHKGQAFINEGNNRVAAAAAAGVEEIRARVYWINGGEQASGAWTPLAVAAKAKPFQSALSSRGWQRPPRNPQQGSFEAPHDERVRRALFDSTDTLLNRIRRSASAFAMEGIRKLQDREIDLLRTQNAIERASGPLSEPKNAYLAASLYPGRVAQRDRDLVQDFIEPLVDEIAERKLTLEEVDQFNMARHAFERNIEVGKINKPGTQFHEAMTNPAIVGGSGLSDNEASAILQRFQNEGKYADLEAVGDKIVALNARTLRSLYNEGLITQEQYDSLTQKYQYYVPLRGWDDVTDDSHPESPRTGRRYDVRGKEFQQAFGRTSKADSPLAYSIMQARQAIIRIEKNRVGKRFLRLAQANPNEAFWQVERRDMRRVLDSNTGYVRNVFDRNSTLAENVYAVKVGGKAYHITIHHEGLLRAMKGIGGENMHGVFATLHRITRFLAAVRTQYNPEFLFTNFFRDLQQAGIVLQEEDVAKITRKVIASLPSAAAGMNRMLQGDTSTAWARHAREFADAGGRIGFVERNDIQAEKQALDQLMADANPGLGREVWLRLMELTIDRLDRYNDVVENTMRLAAYVAMREAGASQDRAASVARELTVNFNRKGEWGPQMNSLYMFFNASTQGGANFALRLYRSKKLRGIAGGLIVYGFVQSMLNRMLSGDDDDDENRWDKLSMSEKQRNHIIMLPKWLEDQVGLPYVKIPAPLSWNLPMIIGMQVEHSVAGAISPLEAAANIVGAIGDAFNPLGSGGSFSNFIAPTIADPWVDIDTNRNFFGEEIVPRQFDETTPYAERYGQNVNPYARWLTDTLSSMTGGSSERSGAIDWSPEWVEHIYEFTLGGIGQLFSRTSTTIDTLAKGEDIDVTKVPFARVFAGRDFKYADRDKYFQIRDAVHVTEKELKARIAEGDTEAARAVRQKYAREVQMIGLMDTAEKRLAKLRKEYKAVKKAQNMGEATRRDRLTAISTQMDEIQLKVRTRWNQLGKTPAPVGGR